MDNRIKILKNMLHNNDVKIYVDDKDNIIIEGDIIIYDNEYNNFPVKLYRVNGNIEWHGNTDGMKSGSLSSFKNFPDIVTGNVYVYGNNKLQTLKNCPKEIGGTFDCSNCNISDISDISEKIKGHLHLQNNPIYNVDVLSKVYIGGNIYIYNTNWSKLTENKHIETISDSSLIITNKISYEFTEH